MFEFDTNPKVRFEFRINNKLKHKISDIALKNHTKPGLFVESFLNAVDFENFKVLDKRINLLLPIDEDNYKNLIVMTTSNGKDMKEYINSILRSYFGD